MINKRLVEYRDALGLGPGRDFHSLRRSYVTHLIEAGWNPLIARPWPGLRAAAGLVTTAQSAGV